MTNDLLFVVDEKNCRKGERKLSQRHSFFLGRPYLPSSATVSVGGRLEVNCYISGYPIPQVFWLKDGRQVKDSYPEDDLQVFLKRHGHVFQLIIPSARLHHAGLWEVVARNLAGLVISSSYIHVIDVHEVRTSMMLSWSTNVDEFVTVFRVRWEFNGEELQQSNLSRFKIVNEGVNHRVVLKDVDASFSGRYSVTAENSTGIATCSALLTVQINRT
ncbi:unnamed protein product [Mesocestoides corti]|uniref:Ig-like domain-containing protein n=1 Tax=Mesocestoides corti TaxID=53468 RepID=A0A0R3UEA2_MESCO|nr:unnamed protein product [Mesocestoides corti]